VGDKILVLLGRSYANPVFGLGDVVYDAEKFFSKPEDFKLILFTGGEDIDPKTYGDTSPKDICWYSEKRDAFEKMVYDIALEYEIPMAGICRGLQFLNVMNGGTMMHDISGHAGSLHLMRLISGGVIYVNSIHHQMIIPAKDTKIIAWSDKRLSRRYIGKNDEVVKYNGREYESAIFTKIKGFGVQYHPEAMAINTEGHMFFRNMVRNALNEDWDYFVKMYSKESEDAKLLQCDEHSYTTS
jgi:gamma-glutamyl-gamma-aminobutyrate hydrolase PuuD